MTPILPLLSASLPEVMLLPPRAGCCPFSPKIPSHQATAVQGKRMLRVCGPASPEAETSPAHPRAAGPVSNPDPTGESPLCWAPQKGIFPNAQPQFPGCSSSCFPSSGSPGKSWALPHLELPHKWLWAVVGPLQPPDPAQPFQPRAQGPIPCTVSLSHTSLWVQHSQDGATNTRDFPGCAEPTLTQPRADDERIQTDLGSN